MTLTRAETRTVPAEERNPKDPTQLGQGRPQRGLPVRLGQEVQALPRGVRVVARPSPLRSRWASSPGTRTCWWDRYRAASASRRHRRSLTEHVKLICLDEPTAALGVRADGAGRQAIRSIAASGTGVILVTHDFSTGALADRIVVLSLGRVAYDGSARHLTADQLWGLMASGTLAPADRRARHVRRWEWLKPTSPVSPTPHWSFP